MAVSDRYQQFLDLAEHLLYEPDRHALLEEGDEAVDPGCLLARFQKTSSGVRCGTSARTISRGA
jgi:hypothetical protein